MLNESLPILNDKEPRKVLIRVYGEVLRSSTASIVFDSISFALLSEKGIGPKLYGIFPGGRIEEYFEVGWFFLIVSFILKGNIMDK